MFNNADLCVTSWMDGQHARLSDINIWRSTGHGDGQVVGFRDLAP